MRLLALKVAVLVAEFLYTAICLAQPPATVQTPTDLIPIYGGGGTHTKQAVASGDWCNPATWSGGVEPTAADAVWIPPGITVNVCNTASTCASVAIEGTLTTLVDRDTRLSVGTIEVLAGGVYTVGTQAAPIPVGTKAEVIFRDGGFAANDPDEFGRGLIVLGRFETCGAPKTPFVRITTELLAGASVLPLTSTPQGWEPGDQLCIPDTNPYFGPDGGTWVPERPLLASVGNNSVVLASNLAKDHFGCWDKAGALRYTPHVANNTRNIVFRSESPTGKRGHCLFAMSSQVTIRNTEFAHLGRTRAAPTGPSNHIARYPLHAHHANNVRIEGCGIRDSYRWAMGLHNVTGCRYANNVIVIAEGAGIQFESSTERDNTIEGNFICGITGTGGRADIGQGNEGVGIWISNPQNRINNNVATNCLRRGYTFYNRNLALSIQQFDGNEAYSSSGLTIWELGLGGDLTSHPVDGGVIRDFVCWNFTTDVGIAGIYFYPSGGLTFERATVLSCWKRQAVPWWQKVAVDSGDYHVYKIKFVDSELQAPGQAYLAYACATPVQETVATEHVFERCKFTGGNAVKIGTIWHNGRSNIGPRKIRFTDCRFNEGRSTTWPFNPEFSTPTPLKVWCGIESYRRIRQIMQKDETLFENFDGVQGDSFKLYADEQAPTFVVEPTQPGIVIGGQDLAGVPVAGKTNAEHMALYQRAIRGEVMPAGAVAKAGVMGKVVPLGSPPPPNQPPVAVDDSATTPYETPVTIDVLANDSDPDGTLDQSTVSVTGVVGGTCTVAGGLASFAPAAGFSGTGGFDYTVRDNQGATSNVAHVTITVQAKPPDPTDPCEIYQQRIAALEAQVADLQKQIDDLWAKMGIINGLSKKP